MRAIIERKWKKPNSTEITTIRFDIVETAEGVYRVYPHAKVQPTKTSMGRSVPEVKNIVARLDGKVGEEMQEAIDWIKSTKPHWEQFWIVGIDKESDCFAGLLGIMTDKEYNRFLSAPTIATKKEAVRILNAEVRKRAALLRRYENDEVTDEELAQIGAFKAWVDEVIEKMKREDIYVKFQANGYFGLVLFGEVVQ